MSKKFKERSKIFARHEQPLVEREEGYEGKPLVEVNGADVDGCIISGSDVRLPFRRMPRGLYNQPIVAAVNNENGRERYFCARAEIKNKGILLRFGREYL